MNGKFRSIIEEHLFQVRLEELIPDARRADEFLEAVKILLARLPESGLRIKPESPIWCIPTANVLTITPVIVYYYFDDDTVYLVDIRKTELYPE